MRPLGSHNRCGGAEHAVGSVDRQSLVMEETECGDRLVLQHFGERFAGSQIWKKRRRHLADCAHIVRTRGDQE